MQTKCNLRFQSNYALLDGNQIDIDAYLNDTTKNGILRCINNGHELIAVRCKTRRSHFRHKHDNDVDGTHMTEWHLEWQSNFPIIERPFEKLEGQIKERRADILLPEFNNVIEIQHSKMDSEEVMNRINDYKIHNHCVKWILDAQGSVDVKIYGERRILHFNTNTWLYENFKVCDTVYYDINGFIYKVNPSLVKQGQIDVLEPKLKSEFIEALKANNDIWDEPDPPQCYLHVKQQGAGSGKTYGMMQLINSDPEISNYKYIAFLTKQHSAVAVMYKEFKEQYDDGKLTNIKDLTILKDPKKYIVKYKNTLTNVDVHAIFGTVDSFTYALADPAKNSRDTFTGIIEAIKDGVVKTSKSGSMTYAGINPILNKEMLIMIDETQDLTELYGEAFLQIVKSKYTNLCVVGDRLQSLCYKDNSLTFLHTAEMAGLRVIKANASNTVRRFSDPILISFVNSIIPFKKYGLPDMTPHQIVESTNDCLTVFSAKTVYANASAESQEVTDAITDIMSYYMKEVDKYGRVPEDFLIVTGTTSKNPIMESLQLALNMYWKKKMEDEIYITNVKDKHDYWKNIDTSSYIRYAVFHKSQEGTSINTAESEHATRMVSIHSSKGDGRKVVFVIGVSQSTLRLFSQDSNNLIYDSLLHVAVTRQKERLYFRLEPNGDDIHHKIMKSGVTLTNTPSNTEFNFLKKKIKHAHLSRDICSFSYDDVYANIIIRNPPPKIPYESESKLLIDMGDHNIRYASIYMNVWVHACNYTMSLKDNKKQFFAILKGVTEAKIETVNNWKDYLKFLQKNTNPPKGEKKIIYIPIIQYPSDKVSLDYDKYFKIILSIIQSIIKKLDSLGKKNLDYFCPIESIVLYYMIECTQNGKYQAITIDNLYNIVDIYSTVFTPSAGHENCNCNTHFSQNKKNLTEVEEKYKEYLCNHYDRLEDITRLLDSFNTKYTNISWLYSHQVDLRGGRGEAENNDFKVYNRYPMIGYDDKNVFIINIKPQLTELNYNEFLIDSILDTFIIMNTHKSIDTPEKFKNKEVLSCVLSMNKEDIYTINWTAAIKENADYIKTLLSNILTKRFGNMHSQYYNAFKNIIEESEEQSPSHIIEVCNNKCRNVDNFAPEYIERVFNVISHEIESCETKKDKKRVIKKYKNEDTFVKLLNSKLKVSIQNFLGIEEITDDDSNDEYDSD